MKKFLIAMLALILLLVLAVEPIALAASYPYGSNTTPIKSGQLRETSRRKKEDAQELVVAPTMHNPAYYIVYFRGLNSGDQVATEYKYRISPDHLNAFSLAYKSGEGIVNAWYKLQMRNPDSNGGPVYIKGTWEP